LGQFLGLADRKRSSKETAVIIWLILIASFIAGIFVMATGKLKTSNRRQITGRNATFVGIGLIVIPIFVLAATFSGIAISRWAGSTTESADTHGNIFGVLLLSFVAILFARNVKRLSEPIIAIRSKPNSDDG
jgi:Na+/phosphate symporter